MWHEYIDRLRAIVRDRNLPDEEVLVKLKKDKIPLNYQVFLYSSNTSLSEIIAIIKELETTNNSKDTTLKKDGYNVNKRNFNNIKCYRCGKNSHIKRYCKFEDRVNMVAEKNIQVKREIVKINCMIKIFNF